MSIQAIVTAGQLQPGFCWTNAQDFVQALVSILNVTFPGTFNSFNFGNAVPAPGDRNKPWFRLNPDGTPDRWYVYLGGWISPNPRAASSKERIIWMDTEANLWAYDGGDGTNPGTNAPTPTTGAMWQRDTTFGDEVSNIFRVPIGIGKNPTSYDGGAPLQIAVGGTGGVERVALAVNQTPKHQHTVGSRDSTADDGGNNSQEFVNNFDYAGANVGPLANTSFVGGDGSGNTVSHDNLPPYVGVIYGKRTSRVFYSV